MNTSKSNLLLRRNQVTELVRLLERMTEILVGTDHGRKIAVATPQDDQLCDTEEAGRRLGLSPRTLEKFRVNGGGPPFTKLGRRVMYRICDLNGWAADRVCEHTSDHVYEHARQRVRGPKR